MDEKLTFSDNSPSWRWDLISAMVEESRAPSRRKEDAWIRQGYQFLRRWAHAEYADIPSLKRDYPNLFSAHLQFVNSTSERWIIEAGLIARVPHDVLGSYIGVPASVISCFETNFFDIASKLDSPGYVVNRILCPSIHGGLSGRDFDFMYKLVAYASGWSAFTELVEVKHMSNETEDWLKVSVRQGMWKLGLRAIHCLNVNQYNALEVIEKCLDLARLEREEGPAMAHSAAEQLVKGLLGECKLNIIPSTEQLESDELRATEMVGGPLMLRFGDTIPIEKG
jgi:hypothetical protein